MGPHPVIWPEVLVMYAVFAGDDVLERAQEYLGVIGKIVSHLSVNSRYTFNGL